ncbi:MAG: hypothetical protein ONB05_05180, partial [candidate division KSB1 bacterium]|nr:hypothetical protein [candidate division KSB1 bacterium]
AEEMYWPVTSLYLYEPDGKVHFIIRDHDDISNGVTYYYDNKIEIWASAMDFELRGTHNWLRNVVTHEFTHMISLGAARKLTRQIPAVYLQLIDYEKEKRPDVLYGYPNTIISYPLAGTIIPPWFAEGLAQFQLPGLNYDTWDSHRDMILRTATLDNSLLSFNEMTVFEKNSLGNEMVYNQGYSLVSYIARKYGVETLRRLAKAMKAPWRYSFNAAVKKVLGISEKDLYQEWKKELEILYRAKTQNIKNNLVEGTILQQEGLANLYPVWSPDGKSFAFISNRGQDYLSQTSLYVYSFDTRKLKHIRAGVTSSVSWSPDGTKLVYAKKTDPNKYGCHFFDIYTYDLKKNKERRVSRNLRAHSPDWSPDGQQILCVVGKDGTENLAILNLETDKLTFLTHFNEGQQIYRPRWSKNGKVIVFAISTGNNRDIALMSSDGKTYKVLLEDQFDARDPVFSPDGRKIYFSWDKTGIFNIYSLNLYTGEKEQLTNVLGGAFMPSVNNQGQLLYSLFASGKYNLALLKEPRPIEGKEVQYIASQNDFHLASLTDEKLPVAITNPGDGQYDDTQVPDYPAEPYKNTYSKITLLPLVRMDYGKTKAGSYFYSSDVLDKYSILGSFAMNRYWDYDLFGIVQYRKFRPTLFLEAYNMVRHTKSTDYPTPADSARGKVSNINYKYNLLEVDVGTSLKLNDTQNLRLAFIYSRYGARYNTKSEAYKQEIKAKATYFIGKDISLSWNYRNILPSVNSEINPTGRDLTIYYDYELNNFIKGFKISDYGTIVETYKPYKYSKIRVDWREYFGLFKKKHALALRFKGGYIYTEEPLDSFFNLFAGGLDGLRGYPYYSIEGRKLLTGSITYRFPIFKHLNFRCLQFYFDKFYGGLFYEYGNAFDKGGYQIDFSKFKKDVGLELRLDTVSFYTYPARLFFTAAYGLDEFTNRGLTYGKEWRFYFGLSFGYWD